MRFISNSIELVECMINNDSKYKGKIMFDDFPMRSSSDMALVNEALDNLSKDAVIAYDCKNGIVTYNILNLKKFFDFYAIRKKLDQLYHFIHQGIRDACCVRHFKMVLKTTAIARETMASCIYNFSSAVSININKIFVDDNGKYNIECLAADVRNYLNKYNLTAELNNAKELKKAFSSYRKTVDNKIREFNDYRDTLFAHSDKNIMLKVENVDIESAYNILVKCLCYCCKLIDIVDDDKTSEVDEKSQLHYIDLEANYFSSQLIRK